MKKKMVLLYQIPLLILFLLLFGCESSPASSGPEKGSLGILVVDNTVPEESTSTIILSSNLTINKYNETSVNWTWGYSKIVIPSGRHVLFFGPYTFSGGKMTKCEMTRTFEPGITYSISFNEPTYPKTYGITNQPGVEVEEVK